MPIPVFILSRQGCDGLDLAKLFKSDGFTVTITTSKKDRCEAVLDTGELLHCLSEAKASHPTKHCIVIKANSITNADAGIVSYLVHGAAKQDFDVMYLCKWDDKCQRYTDKLNVGMLSYSVKTQAPHGLQAVMLSPCGRDKVLGDKQLDDGSLFEHDQDISSSLTKQIYLGNISARALVPNLFDFDIKQAYSNSDYAKLSQCQDVESFEIKRQDSVMTPTFGILLSVILVLLILAGMYLAIEFS